MKNVPTGVLRSPPADWSPGWKQAFQTLAAPVCLIIGLHDALAIDIRSQPEMLCFWLGDLLSYYDLLGDRRSAMDEALATLDSVAAYRTLDVGYQIRKARSEERRVGKERRSRW